MAEIIAKRILDIEPDNTMEVILYKPEIDQTPGGDGKCLVKIDSTTRTIFGIDSFQALMLAIDMINAELDYLRNKKGIRLKWLDTEDLGFKTFFNTK